MMSGKWSVVLIRENSPNFAYDLNAVGRSQRAKSSLFLVELIFHLARFYEWTTSKHANLNIASKLLKLLSNKLIYIKKPQPWDNVSDL